MLQLSCLVFFTTLWFSLVSEASITTSDKYFTLPTNLKIHLYPGIINVTWDCNITKSMEENSYHIEIQHQKGSINISKCFYEYFISDHVELVIHNGLDVKFTSSSESKAEKVIPEGKKNTAVENLICQVYSVSYVNCSWSVGREAPNDTQYSLAFRQTLLERQAANRKQKRVYAPCENYRNDSFGRQVGCVLKAQNIYFNVSIYVQVVGSSSESSIQFFDNILTLDNYVILDPPRNIQLNNTSNELKITWDTPETYSNSDSNCFKYSLNINGEIKDDINTQVYKTSYLNLNENVNVSVRVKWEDFCSENNNWSKWSNPLIKEPDLQHFGPLHLLLALGIITFVILFLLIFLCHRFQVWKRLFPQIPKPANKLFETIEQKEILFQEQYTVKKCLPEEDEECFCSQVTEISQAEQPYPQNHYQNIVIHEEC